MNREKEKKEETEGSRKGGKIKMRNHDNRLTHP